MSVWSKVKVTSRWKSEIWPFSKAISSAIYNRGWQMTTDSYIRAQNLKIIGVLVFVSRDFEVGLSVSRSPPPVPYGANLFWLTFLQGVLSTYWCCPSRPWVVFLACVHLALFLALSLSPGNFLVSSLCDHSMLASLLWQCLTVPS